MVDLGWWSGLRCVGQHVAQPVCTPYLTDVVSATVLSAALGSMIACARTRSLLCCSGQRWRRQESAGTGCSRVRVRWLAMMGGCRAADGRVRPGLLLMFSMERDCYGLMRRCAGVARAHNATAGTVRTLC